MEKLDRIYIEISNICNLQCTFCPVVERDKKIMSISDFKKCVLQAAPLAKQICLHLMGEPLAHPDFREIINFCEQHQIILQITTNGILLEKYKDLLCSQIIRQINFSVQSFKDNYPDKPVEDYLLKILEFTRFLNEKNPETYVNFRLWNVDLESSENEDVISYMERYFQIEINRRVDVAHRKSKRIWNKAYLHFDTRFEWPSFDLPHQGTKGRCYGLVNHIGIHADGVVVPCCLDKEANIPLGNIFDSSLSEILDSQRAIAMKRGFENGIRVEKFCQHCTFINRF